MFLRLVSWLLNLLGDQTKCNLLVFGTLNESNMLKNILFQHCAEHLNRSLLLFEKRKAEILEALASDSKNSAGDKHETGRAMIQLEREKLGEQIKETERNLRLLLPLENHRISDKASLGSIIHTDTFNYYMAISAPKVVIDDTPYYCISAQSPIGRLILGKKVGDPISFNGKTSCIRAII